LDDKPWWGHPLALQYWRGRDYTPPEPSKEEEEEEMASTRTGYSGYTRLLETVRGAVATDNRLCAFVSDKGSGRWWLPMEASIVMTDAQKTAKLQHWHCDHDPVKRTALSFFISLRDAVGCLPDVVPRSHRFWDQKGGTQSGCYISPRLPAGSALVIRGDILHRGTRGGLSRTYYVCTTALLFRSLLR
jgi:hypothetical protein